MGCGENDSFAFEHERYQLQIVLTSGFWIAATPITRRQASILHEIPSKCYDVFLDGPMSQVTWDEAVQLCRDFTDLITKSEFLKLEHNTEGYMLSLPTTAQWEYACRAATKSIWHFGNDPKLLSEYASYKQKPFEVMPKVGEKKPNPWGLYDMYGMVHEWCLDNFLDYKYWTQTVDPFISDTHPKVQELRQQYPSEDGAKRKVVRGGSILDMTFLCRSGAYISRPSNNRHHDLTGMRPVIIPTK